MRHTVLHSTCSYVLRPDGVRNSARMFAQKKRKNVEPKSTDTSAKGWNNADMIYRRGKTEEKRAKSFRSRGRFVTISYASYSFEWFASKSLVRIIIYRIWQVKFLGALPLASHAHVHALSVRQLISMRRCSRIFFLWARTHLYAPLMCVFFVHAIN